MDMQSFERAVEELRLRQTCFTCQKTQTPGLLAYAKTAAETCASLKGFCSYDCYTRFLQEILCQP